MKKTTLAEIGGKTLSLSNLDKELYPESGFTKGEVIDYYARIAAVMLPHLRNRPLTLKRYPEGVGQFFFYEKNCPAHRPSWVPTAKIRGASTDTSYCVVNDQATLVWVANLASLEFHTVLSRYPDTGRAVMAVFDLDPGPGCTMIDCMLVLLELRKILERFKIKSFPKTSGGKGMHLGIPLNIPESFDRTKEFTRSIATGLEKRFPEKITSNMRKDLRKGRVFVDWSQNSLHKTTVCAYSLRARERPVVSAPVTWEEIGKAVKSKKEIVFEAGDVLKRVKRLGDLFAPVAVLKQKLPKTFS